jgi:hypothetical protein
MTWMMLTLYFQKAFLWCKHHWKIVAIGLWTLIVFFVSRRNTEAYKKVLDSTIENYKKEVEILENSHKAEVQKRNDAVVAHNQKIAELEKNYANSKESLSVEKRARYLELAQLYETDPENVSQLIKDEFGFEYVE